MGALTRRLAQSPALVALCAALTLASDCNFFDPLEEGRFRAVFAPPDTSLELGRQFQARGLMINRYGDVYPSEHFAFRSLDSAVRVTSGGLVTGLFYGTARIEVSREYLADTGRVSVVPAGVLALSSSSVVGMANVDGAGAVGLAPVGQAAGQAAWLAGNGGLVFTYAIPGGAGARRLDKTDLLGNVTTLAATGRDPRVSRDGAWVYFSNGSAIVRVTPAGAGLDTVTAGTPVLPDLYPDPSPDGTRLVFASLRFGSGGLQLAVRDSATGAETPFGLFGSFPRWSPSGDSIAYVDAPTSAIFVVSAAGTGARRVSGPGRVYSAAGLDWSPDGQWIVAVSSVVEVIHVATGLEVPLLWATGLSFPAWRW